MGYYKKLVSNFKIGSACDYHNTRTKFITACSMFCWCWIHQFTIHISFVHVFYGPRSLFYYYTVSILVKFFFNFEFLMHAGVGRWLVSRYFLYSTSSAYHLFDSRWDPKKGWWYSYFLSRFFFTFKVLRDPI